MLDNPLQLYTNDCREAVELRKYLRNHRRRCVDVNDKAWVEKLFYLLPVRPLPANNPEDVAETGDDVPLINA